MNFLRSMLSEGGTQPSTTRLCLLLVVLTACAPVIRDVCTGQRADNTIVVALLGTLGALKAFEKKQQKEGKSE